MAKGTKSDPNIKTFEFIVGYIDRILDTKKGIGGYMDNKKLFVASVIKEKFEEFEKLKSEKAKEKFAENILVHVDEIQEMVDVKLRPSARDD